MSEHRRLMLEAFKRRFVPALRERGFKGSFPHFHRRSQTQADYLSVIFSSRGGRFVLEIGSSGPNGFEKGPWKDLPVEKIGPMHCSNRRRIEPSDRRLGDRNWWIFGPAGTDEPRPPGPREHYDSFAEDALGRFLEEGEPWLARPPQPETEPLPPEPPRPAREGLLHRMLPWNRPRLRIACVTGTADPPLHRWENWSRIVPAMTALVERLPRPTGIRSFQTRPGSEKRLPFGAMRWSEANNRRWTSEYLEGSEPADFYSTEFWSPSRSASVEQRRDPLFYARVESMAFMNEQSFILALRLDQLPAAGAAADAVLDAVCALIPDARRLICDRRWEEGRLLGVMTVNNLDDRAASSAMEYAETHPRARVESFAASR